MRILVNVYVVMRTLPILFLFLKFTTKEFVSAASTRPLTLKTFLAPEYSRVNLCSCVHFIFP
jgi:hypothetical protein